MNYYLLNNSFWSLNDVLCKKGLNNTQIQVKAMIYV